MRPTPSEVRPGPRAHASVAGAGSAGRAWSTILGALLLLPAPARAQDAHYWSQQYGTRSELLGGTVVGSPQDLSTTYYNPGGLAFLEDQSFLLSALALQLEQFSLSAGGTDGDGLESDRFGPAPILVAGTLPRHWIDGTLAYSYLSRQKFEARIDSWGRLGDEPDAPVANVLIDARVSENWGGLSWSRASGSVGFGGTLYGVYRSQRAREELLAQPAPDLSTSRVASVNDYSYWHVRSLAKVGVYWAREGASLGLAYTTPGIPLFGGGEASYFRSLQSDSTTLDLDAAGVDDDPPITYRSPMSVAAGSRFEVGGAAVYVTAEWFDSVEPYRVLAADGIPESGPGSSLGGSLRQQLRSVLNLGIGAEFAPSDYVMLFGSVITDRTAANEDPFTGHSFATWDIYQGTAGAAFTLLDADFTLGVSFGGGDSTLRSLAELDAEGPLSGGDVSYRRWKIFLGFEFSGSGDERGTG